MFAFLLGLSWLVLTPVCIWLLFGRGHKGVRRATGALTLAALQAITMTVGFAQEPARVPAQTVAVRDPRAEARPTPSPSVVAAATPSPEPGHSPACDPRVPDPQAVRLSFRGRVLHGLTVFWPASPAQCDTATVAVHQAGRRLRIWVQEGAEARQHEGAHNVPVRVEQGIASLSLRLSSVTRNHRRYVAINGHTGDKIPLRSRTS
ncbi:hypothetical protein OHB01_20135 [Microbispora hainanensis]|uniref:hypothetical protein n=1 Tax=Microbispora TaxID=2005 RepID=UPI001158C26A|nr:MULTISPECIES: hypothetical protein [Microbispora]NJP24769.1 hypothetical protein [Microbispora sp. CL1-1]TQS14239.1 hypothetical protein FLW53_11205 [Microbispora sp. SCL1-1]